MNKELKTPEMIEVGGKRYTNRHGLPPEIVRAILKERYFDPDERPFDESASTLVAPVQITTLKRRHPDKLRVQDVTDCFWQFMGSVAHQVLEDSWHEGMSSVVEERIYAEVEATLPDGTTATIVVSGKTDCFDEPEIRDYKTCKVYKIQKGDFEEWEKGQNVYGWLLRKNGKTVERLNVWALVFDWKAGETYKPNYPVSPIVQVPLRLWPFEEAEAFVFSRVQAIKDAEPLPDDQLPECSKKEMWQDLRDVCVRKIGADRATKKFDQGTAEEMWAEAKAYFEEKRLSFNTHEIVERWSERTRCHKWCEVAPVCHQHRRLCTEEGTPVSDEPCIF